MDRAAKYNLLRYAVVAYVGAGFGIAVSLQIPLVALLSLLTGLALLALLRSAYRDIILVDERVIRIQERAAAQTLRVFMVAVGFTYIGLMVLRVVGFEVSRLWNLLLPLTFIVGLLIAVNYGFYLYYRARM
jgi:uncharacterized membrane protein